MINARACVRWRNKTWACKSECTRESARRRPEARAIAGFAIVAGEGVRQQSGTAPALRTPRKLALGVL